MHFIARIKLFLEESRIELRRVNWPHRDETLRYTVFVIALSLGIAVFFGIIDFFLLEVLKNVVLAL